MGSSVVTTTVVSERRSPEVQPIIAEAEWGQSQVDGNKKQDKQAVFITVSQGYLMFYILYVHIIYKRTKSGIKMSLLTIIIIVVINM